MGLLRKNDIEIELRICANDDRPNRVNVKLRDVKDAGVCERLIDKLSGLATRPKDEQQ